MNITEPYAELFVKLFESFAKKYETGNRQFIELADHRGKCTVAPIKIVSSHENGSENNKGALCLHLDEYDKKDDFLVLCSFMPKDGKLAGEILEIRPNFWQSPADKLKKEPKMKLDVSWDPKSEPMARILTLDSGDDIYTSRIVDIACELLKDAKQHLRSGCYSEAEFSQNGTKKFKATEIA